MGESTKTGLLNILKELVSLFDTKYKATWQALTLLIIFYLWWENNSLKSDKVKDTINWSQKEIQIYQAIILKYDPEFQKIKATTDSMKRQVDTTTNIIRPVVNRLNQKLNQLK